MGPSSINLKDVKEFLLQCENKEIKVFFVEVGKDNELVLKPEKVCPQYTGKLNKNCIVFFNVSEDCYTFSGQLYCNNPERILIINRTPIIKDRRSEKRISVPMLLTNIKEKGMFSRNIIDGHTTDLSSRGARIRVLIPLNTKTEYNIEIHVMYRQKLHTLKASFFIKNSNEQSYNYCYGVLFANLPQESKEILDNYLLELKGKLSKDSMNVNFYSLPS